MAMSGWNFLIFFSIEEAKLLFQSKELILQKSKKNTTENEIEDTIRKPKLHFADKKYTYRIVY